jgi:hypothetical protein
VRLRTLLSGLDTQQQSYFFGRLHNPKVFKLLEEIGAFAPPDQGQGNTASWPVSSYLRNVAEKVPLDVARVLQSISAPKGRLLYDLLDVASALPAEQQADSTDTLIRWLSDTEADSVAYNYLKIVERLVEAETWEQSLAVARALLAVQPRRGVKWPRSRKRSVDAVPKIGPASYAYILQRIVQLVAPNAGDQLIGLLGDLIHQALLIEGFEDAGTDYSSIWRRDLDAGEIGLGPKESLAHQLFKIALDAVSNRERLRFVLSLLHSWPEPLFRRIRLRLIVDHGTLSMAEEELNANDFFTARELDSERDALLSHFFPELSTELQASVVARLRLAVPTRERIAKTVFADEPDASSERIERLARRMLFEHLSPIGPYLRGSDAEEYSRLSEEFPRQEEPIRSGSVWIGPTSPREVTDFMSMATSEIIAYVNEWQPEEGFMKPTREGLGRALESVVDARYREFLDRVDDIMVLQPTYVWHAINAVRKHVNEDGFPFDQFLRLLSYSWLRVPDAAAGKFADLDEDDDDSWSTTRQMTAFALTDSFRSNCLALSHRAVIWQLLQSLLVDQDPSPEREKRHKSGEPWNLALNSVRGAAMLALFDYARWVYKSSETVPRDLSVLAPEVLEELDRHLITTTDPSEAVRSTYGQNFVSLYVMAHEWTTKSIPAIFRSRRRRRLGAAWAAYLTFNGAYDETYSYLAPYYRRAVSALERNASFPANERDKNRGLGAHLVRLFARGVIPLDDDGVMAVFIRRAPARTLGNALWSAGAGIAEPSLPPEIWRRLETLYEFVLNEYRGASLEDRRAALDSFGVWFVAPSIDRSWALDILVRTLEMTEGSISIENRVLEPLAELSVTEPESVAKAVLLMLAPGVTFAMVHGSVLRTILTNAIAAGGGAHALALEIDNVLASHGFHQLRDVFERK